MSIDRDDVRILMSDLAITCRDEIHSIDSVYVDRFRTKPATKEECLRQLRASAKALVKEAARILEATAEEP